MLSRAPVKLNNVGRKVGMFLLLMFGGALVGAVVGVFVSLVFPDRFSTIVTGSAAVFGIGIPLLSWRDAGTWPERLQDNPERKKAKIAARLARLRKPSWSGMGREVAGACACLAATAFLILLPGASVPHFVAAFLLLRVPGRVIRSVGGKWERIIGGSLTSSSALIVVGAYSLQNPHSVPAYVLNTIGVWAVFDFAEVLWELRKDYRLMKSPDWFEIT